MKIPVVDGGQISAFDISTNDYEHQDGTVTYAAVTLSCQPKCTFEFKGTDILEAPNSPYWTRCADAGARVVKANVSKTLGGLFTAAACTGGKVVLSAVTSLADIADLREDCTSRVADTVLALSPTLYNETLPLLGANVLGDQDAVREGYIGNLFGFKAVIQMNDLPNGILGAIIPTDSVAVASRAVAVGDPSCYSEIATYNDEYGFTLTALRHGSAAKGKGFINLTTLFGAALVQPSKIKYIAAS